MQKKGHHEHRPCIVLRFWGQWLFNGRCKLRAARGRPRTPMRESLAENFPWNRFFSFTLHPSPFTIHYLLFPRCSRTPSHKSGCWLFNSGLSKDTYGQFTLTFFACPKKVSKKRTPRAQTAHRAPILRIMAFYWSMHGPRCSWTPSHADAWVNSWKFSL